MIDLGLAARDRTVKVSSGTRNYAAPETVNREVQSLVSDFYSLGIILYELIFGEKPYVKETWDQVRTHLVLNPPQILKQKTGFSEDCKDFVNALLHTKAK